MSGAPPPPGRRDLVTGCAGFLGSQLAERLVAEGREVLGIDCFTPNYPRAAKERNLELLMDEPRFAMVELDLAHEPLESVFDGIDVVFHLAGQPGVRGAFGERFEEYLRNNVRATQRLLEHAARSPISAFVFASSSSVYGDAAGFPTTELDERRPVSPYGMTKVATEELAWVYMRCFGVPAVGLRYFTAYGPRQRPDMAFSRFFARALAGQPLPINGDGRQVRDFTFVDDILAGTLAAARLGRPGAVYNIGGGSPVELLAAIRMIAELTGRSLDLEHRPAPVGEARRTSCNGELARRELGFVPCTDLRDGLEAQLEWIQTARRLPTAAVAA